MLRSIRKVATMCSSIQATIETGKPCERRDWELNAAGKSVRVRHAADTSTQARADGLVG